MLFPAGDLRPINYKDDLEAFLSLLTIIIHHNFNPQLLLKGYMPIEKEYCYEIESIEKARLNELEKELKEVKKTCAKLENEVLKLQYLISPISVNIT